METIDLPRERGALERLADIAAGYVLIAAVAALGLFGITAAVQLERCERALAAEARV